MRLAISQSNYLPWIGYFKLISQVDHFIFYDSAQYTKNDWRNRNKIVRNRAIEWLTIPVQYSYSKSLSVSEVLLPDGAWRDLHLKRVDEAYGISRNFELFRPKFASALMDGSKSLSELNHSTVGLVCEFLGINTELDSVNQPNNFLGRSERLVDLCIRRNAETYVTTPKALNYLNLNLFEDKGIQVEVIDFSSCITPYSQKSNSFDPFVSIIDLIANAKLIEIRNRLLN
jgi:hypothetical protein